MRDKQTLSAGRRGFSLMEMLVVLVVIALGTALTIPSMGGARDRMRLRSAAGKTAAALRHARSRAISEQRIMQAFFDLENRRILVRPWPRHSGLSGLPAFGGVSVEAPLTPVNKNGKDNAVMASNDAGTGDVRLQTYSLPGDICYADPRTFRGESVPGYRFQMTFFPGGGSNGGSIRIASGADCIGGPTDTILDSGDTNEIERPGIRVDLITGLVEVIDDAS